MSRPRVEVERLSFYSEADAIDLGLLMPHLSPRLSDEPIAGDKLQAIVASPTHEQIVARREDGVVVGSATLSLVMGLELKRPEAWLGGFVTRPDIRGRGVGQEVWLEILRWCQEHDANLGFTSNSSRTERKDAIRFYKKHGAVERPTKVFHLDV